MQLRVLLHQGPWLPGYEAEAKQQRERGPQKPSPRRQADWWVVYGMVIGLLIGGLVGASIAGAIGFIVGDIAGGIVGALAGAAVKGLAKGRTTRR